MVVFLYLLKTQSSFVGDAVFIRYGYIDGSLSGTRADNGTPGVRLVIRTQQGDAFRGSTAGAQPCAHYVQLAEFRKRCILAYKLERQPGILMREDIVAREADCSAFDLDFRCTQQVRFQESVRGGLVLRNAAIAYRELCPTGDGGQEAQSLAGFRGCPSTFVQYITGGSDCFAVAGTGHVDFISEDEGAAVVYVGIRIGRRSDFPSGRRRGFSAGNLGEDGEPGAQFGGA